MPNFDPAHSTTGSKASKAVSPMDYSPTSIQEQARLNGFLRTERPVGNNGPTTPPPDKGYPINGGAVRGNIAATHPAARTSA